MLSTLTQDAMAPDRRPRPHSSRALGALLLGVGAAACADPAGPTDPGDPRGSVPLALDIVAQGLSSPLFLTAPVGDERLFVVERGGLVRIVEGGVVLGAPFLDVHGEITAGGERGLLGLAFHPAYAGNGHFYVNYTDGGGDTQIVRYTVSADRNVADPATALPILSVDQPDSNHNGGMLAFGPDGMLYVGMGDGGGVGDPDDNGQRPETLLGSILRLDVDAGTPYAIPDDNPFAHHATFRHETWAYGLRNPWRFSFDRATGDLYVGDVGQGAREEIDFQPAASTGGQNYGWRVMEGTGCYRPTPGCSTSGLTLPAHEYGHDEGCSVTGGYVYRGAALTDLAGRYVFADFCDGWIRSFAVVGGTVQNLQDHSAALGTVPSIASFGEDGGGELYVVSLAGTIYKLVEGRAP